MLEGGLEEVVSRSDRLDADLCLLDKFILLLLILFKQFESSVLAYLFLGRLLNTHALCFDLVEDFLALLVCEREL